MAHFRIIALFLCFTTAAAFSQSAEEEVIRLKQEGLSTGAEKQEAPPNGQKGNLGLSVGTSYSWMQGYGSFMGYSLMPTYTYPLNKRWSLHGGLIASTYYGLNQVPAAEGLLANPSMSSLAVFGAASYRMTERLVLHGAGVKQLLSVPGPGMTSYTVDNLSLGATYHFGDNFSIGASVQFRNAPAYGGFYPGSAFGASPSPFAW